MDRGEKNLSAEIVSHPPDYPDEAFDDDDLEEDFEQATEFMKTVAGDMEKSKLLYFYARFKQATVGDCNIPRPGMFDFQGKQKWDSWNGLKGMGPEQAMTEYMSAMDDVDPDWMTKVKGQKSSTGGLGLGVSTMAGDGEVELSDNEKSVFDWCKEGHADQVRLLLAKEGANINQVDEDGMTLLHWACDRGHLEIVTLLLERKAHIDAVDSENQTGLHYACTCEHLPVVEALVRGGSNVNARDVDGNTPGDTTCRKDILHVLSRTPQVT